MSKTAHRDEYNVYNSGYGLCVNVGQNEGKTAWVLNMHMSPKIPGEKKYNWEAGLRFQLTEEEICDFYACISNRKNDFKAIRNIGVKSNKYLNLYKNDSGSLALSMKADVEKRMAMMVALTNPERVKLSIYAFKCIMKNNGGISQECLFFLHNRIYS